MDVEVILNRFFGLIILISLVYNIKADFFAYQCWTDTKSGKTVHEFFDIDLTKAGIKRANVIKQQNDLVTFIKLIDGIGLFEDNLDQYRQAGFNIFIKPEELSIKLKFESDFFYEDSPLCDLVNKCREEGIECINVDIRDMVSGIGDVLVVDNFAFECIKKAPKQHVVLAMGARHLASINLMLAESGYELKSTILDKALLNEVLVKDYLDVILYSYKTKMNPYKFCFSEFGRMDDCLLASYPLNIAELLQKMKEVMESEYNIKNKSIVAVNPNDSSDKQIDEKRAKESQEEQPKLEKKMNIINAIKIMRYIAACMSLYHIYNKQYKYAGATAIASLGLFLCSRK